MAPLRAVATPMAFRPSRARLRGSFGPLAVPPDVPLDEVTPAVPAEPDPDDPFAEGAFRGTAVPTLDESGGAVRVGGGGGGADSAPELEEPEFELVDPELDAPAPAPPLETACAQANEGEPTATVTRRQTAQRVDLNMTPSRGPRPDLSNCLYCNSTATEQPSKCPIGVGRTVRSVWSPCPPGRTALRCGEDSGHLQCRNPTPRPFSPFAIRPKWSWRAMAR